MKKEEVIKREWLKFGNISENNFDILSAFINEDGWAKVNEFSIYSTYEKLPSELFDIDLNRPIFQIRPKSLQGIENNNGWIPIKSQIQLNELFGQYWVRTKLGELRVEVIISDLQKIHVLNYCSHYQPVQKPNPVHY